MEPDCYRFDAFELDRVERQLRRGGDVLALNARYLDALILLVRERGGLVTKDRFMDEVWRGVPVTDEALTQCIRTLRRVLGDEAGAPRFIATVPKYGYRFVAPVAGEGVAPPAGPASEAARSLLWRLGAGGTRGAIGAGLAGGLIYGILGASLASPAESGALSIVLVLMAITVGIAAIGGSAVAFGVAAGVRRGGEGSPLALVGGAGAGLAVGALAKLLGIDAFTLLLGRSPQGITGGPEGLALGGAVGLAWYLAVRVRTGDVRGAAIIGMVCGALAGLVIAVLGGRLLAGSLDVLTQAADGARLDLGRIGALLGERGFGLRSRVLTSVLEGGLFGGLTVAGLWRGREEASRTPAER
ncbi:transcriptional regulator [Sphingomonas sp. ST-64]|uniref:Transcriptional regulator n=1 Tax=Sphingomonas plantiphila TaxID=3163295 RepID=A0ABW8YPJ7_9SPHN